MLAANPAASGGTAPSPLLLIVLMEQITNSEFSLAKPLQTSPQRNALLTSMEFAPFFLNIQGQNRLIVVVESDRNHGLGKDDRVQRSWKLELHWKEGRQSRFDLNPPVVVQEVAGQNPGATLQR